MSTWFITGTSRGFGAQIAGVALEEGHNVVATARDPERIAAGLGTSPRLLAQPLDVTDTTRIQPAVDAAVQRFGTIDVLVNNAGRGLLGPMEETTEEQVRALFDLNVLAVVNLTRAVLPVMRAQRSGRIVNIGSRTGLGPNAGSSVYDATKHALEGLTGALALEVAPLGIQVTIVEPGVFRTDFLDPSSLELTRETITDYEDGPAGRAYRERIEQNNHAQLGDPVKGARLIYEVATADTMPPRLPMGRDAVEVIERRAVDDPAALAPWRDRSLATAHD
ncbi:NAD(P)-dependent dehydrogenase (short-subunit alcohol dehydrogenase family) [Streptomyces sp. V3I8]|uniref:SDR family NAD(P)-dependent oxidoreductase n=1 Tax=Streptomyces sp. V3I8 TaxID=3042279 RepID=UPI00277F0CF0|nr:SDR family NAD(P)-dependent oxidoreductase [Streptomyces sp. V3I8]MDQ1041637.1 NAD(P)-dependent dehydrogenase (short-subunit alcohol dehydrogenase family) [Streptomyces sp. V3I8]